MAKDLKLQLVLETINKSSKPLSNITKGSQATSKALRETRDGLKQLQQAQKKLTAFRTLKKESDTTSKALGNAQRETQRLAKEIASTQNPSRQLQRDFKRSSKLAGDLKTKLASQRNELQQLRTGLGKAGVNTRSLNSEQRRLSEGVNRANRAMEGQQSRLRRLNALQKQYQKTQAMRGSLASGGTRALAGGAAALYAGGRGIAPGIGFDSAVSNVQAISRLEGDDPRLAQLIAQAKELGAKTQFTAGQAAGAQGYLAMAGFDPEKILAAMPGMLSLAKAGNVELERTADISSNILSGFKLQAGEMGRVGDVLTGTFTRSNTNLEMLGATMSYVAPVAAGLNVDLETTAAMAGKLGDAGIQAERGGTALRSILSRLASPPKMAADAIAKLNLEVADAQGNLRPLPNLLAEVSKKTQGMGDVERTGLFRAIAGTEAVSAFQVLVDQAGGGELQELISTLRTARGEADKTAGVMADNLGGDLARVKSVTEAVSITVTETLRPALRSIVQGAGDVIGKVNEWIKNNPVLAGGILKAAAGLAALSVGLGSVALGLAGILGPVAAARYGLGLLGIKIPTVLGLLKGLAMGFRGLVVAMGPVGWAIALIATAAFLIYQNWAPIKQFFVDLWNDPIATITGFGNFLLSFLPGSLQGVLRTIAQYSPVGLIIGHWEQITGFFESLPEKFKALGSMIMQGLLTGIKILFPGLTQIISKVGDLLPDVIRDKLGIHSPSRVFAEIGQHTMTGLGMGIQKHQQQPVAKVGAVAGKLSAAGMAANGPAAASAPLMAGAGGSAMVVEQINVYAAPGQDPQAIAREVRAELARASLAKNRAGRAALADKE